MKCVLLFLLASLLAGASAAAEPADTSAAGANETAAAAKPVDRRAMQGWLALFEAGLRTHQDERVAELIAIDAKLTQTFTDEGIPPILVTLTRAEYLQQLRALWRFATSTRYDFKDLRGTPAADGSMNVELKLDETWELFGRQTGLNSELKLRLERDSAGTLRATDIRMTTNPW